MPGSKRRALKKLLSPNSSPADAGSPSTSMITGLRPVDSASSAQSGTSIASDSRNYLTDEQIAEQQSELDKMEARKDSIGGTPQSTGLTAGGSLDGVPPIDSLPGQSGEASRALPPPPPPQQGMYGSAAVNGNGNGGGGGGKKSSKQKFAERQARKQQALLDSAPPSDPNWDRQLEKERQDEIRVVSGACQVLGREIHEIAPDGHCMYHAIADQLACMAIIPPEHADNPRFIRQAAAKYMSSHPDEFRFFLPSVGGEDTAEATSHDGVMTEQEYAKYCHNVEHTGEWGGEPEIQALSRFFKVPIHVIQRGPPAVVSHGSADDSFGGGLTPEQSASQGDRVVRISYHRRMYGLGEHYNSLRKVLT